MSLNTGLRRAPPDVEACGWWEEVAPWLEAAWEDWGAVSNGDSEGEPGARPPLDDEGLLLRGEPLASAAARDLQRNLFLMMGGGEKLTLSFDRVEGPALLDMIAESKENATIS